MKLLIFGASGGTGRQLVNQALEQGHEVTAFVRNAASITQSHPGLRIVTGDVLDAVSVTHAMPGHDAVLCSIGSPANKIGRIRSQGTLNIMKAMQKAGVRRLVCQTSLGYGDSKKTLDQTGFVFKYIIVPFILKKGFADHALQETYVKESGLDWIIARPGNLTDGAFTGRYREAFAQDDKHIKVKISRADVAHFMLRQIDSPKYIGKTVGLSY